MSVEMPLPKPWDRPLILDHLSPIVPLLHEAAEAATHDARAFFDGLSLTEAEQRDPFLFAHLVRFHVGKVLSDRGQSAAIDRHWLSNSGVAFRYGWTDIRFLKSSAGCLPPPGRSMTKRRFYSQYIETPIWDFHDDRAIVHVNLVVTWDVDYRGNLSQLVAYSPSDGANTPDSVHWHWREELAHPATTYVRPEPEEPQEEGEDLDIGRDTDLADDQDLADAQ